MNSSLIKKISLIAIAALVLLGGAGGVAWWQFDRVVANQQQMAMATAVSQLDRVTQSAAANSSDIAQAAGALQTQSADLNSGIAQLTQLVGEEKFLATTQPAKAPVAALTLDRADGGIGASTAKSRQPRAIGKS